jgi:Tol biopolymer transport system component
VRGRFENALACRTAGLGFLMFVVSTVASLGLLPAAASALPSGRAYELVSPPDTGAVTPWASAMGSTDGFNCFETDLATHDGERVTFNSELGALEGLTSNGVLNLYEARRTSAGWTTESQSATGQQTTYASGGLCLSPDHEYSTLLTGGTPFDQGSLVINGGQTSYFRTPGGSYVLAGTGSIGTDQRANIRWISDGGAHIIFTSIKRLEPEAPVGLGAGSSYDGSTPVNAIYDRSSSGLRVVSLLPDGVAPNSATETTFYRGASEDGSSVAFEVVKSGIATLYERRNDEPTTPVVTGGVGVNRYAGISADGRRVAYLQVGPSGDSSRGSIYLYDVDTASAAAVTTGAEAALVNISRDGSHIYFISNEVLPGAGQNPVGSAPQGNAPNLYVWSASTEDTKFIATVADADVEEIDTSHENLTEWLRAAAAPQQNAQLGRANDPSRTTPDGSVFVFQSRADITGYDSGGYTEIYRYDESSDQLSCVSCASAGLPAASHAYLQQTSIGETVAFNNLARLANVSDDGRLVFFMTADPLAPEDVNDTYDVYEWKDGVVGLISSGKSPSPSLLYGMSADGRDVFFLTIDRLVPQDQSSVLSIYDARIGGGFPAPAPDPDCDGDACQRPAVAAPQITAVGSEARTDGGQARRHRHRACKHRKHHHCKKRHHTRRGARR